MYIYLYNYLLYNAFFLKLFSVHVLKFYLLAFLFGFQCLISVGKEKLFDIIGEMCSTTSIFCPQIKQQSIVNNDNDNNDDDDDDDGDDDGEMCSPTSIFCPQIKQQSIVNNDDDNNNDDNDDDDDNDEDDDNDDDDKDDDDDVHHLPSSVHR